MIAVSLDAHQCKQSEGYQTFFLLLWGIFLDFLMLFTITGVMYELQSSNLRTCESLLAQLIGELPFVNRKLFCNEVADE